MDIANIEAVAIRSSGIERRNEIVRDVGVDRPYFLLVLKVLVSFDRES